MKQEDFVDITQEIFINFIFTRENSQIDKNKAYSNQSKTTSYFQTNVHANLTKITDCFNCPNTIKIWPKLDRFNQLFEFMTPS